MPIARDASSEATPGFITNSLTWSHTCGGSADILWAGISRSAAGGVLTGVTYNGVAMTEAVADTHNSVARNYLFYLLGPDEGAHNIVASFDANVNQIFGFGQSYSGAQQSGVPDATGTNEHGFGGADLTVSTTTVADNAWVVMCVSAQSVTISAGSGSSLLNSATLGDMDAALLDSGVAVTPAGAYGMTVSISGSSNIGGVTASFAPDSGGGADTRARLIGGDLMEPPIIAGSLVLS